MGSVKNSIIKPIIWLFIGKKIPEKGFPVFVLDDENIDYSAYYS
ncbi:hypothetical protein HMPREF1565_2245 [Providencia alcalifaciens RIMD 1656011]|uniref:Uncharacterized protein n=2 Tax=Providencia alcalifaciens TaxID=126385 RepID=B6XFJ3_9GAMM|nr:hypothetical protein PROVALCAL_02124 [Providencia alcalifaciens DSM 30120]ETT04277.1 hypothetical protein HMPREF1562_3061 [Providencia alcalifaciens F90-2004]EUC95971.1 hypothetical protein HMPREF1567_2770 [Providencia alcalifaciens PAL-2]EUD01715.1 hypothetical protein HMPREF1565_2245 [Providencia alcalifaciens RIMD 1656011]EUD05501.1 hypothetical protein HMPREF1564_0096 [Providencia alcalifaciens R90-1475]EUD12524.1 hypothetical protein HMPREF1563_2480 [Providencia alcalifaciens 205/92]